jgi:GntR family transcriptional regulator, transcriptional repressor for pyruvate dehydrogenase complex
MTVEAFVGPRPDAWSAGLHSLTRVTAADAVLNDLRVAIERGEVAVGIRLPSEASLAHSYAVSRSVVREALRSCASLGLTKTLTGKGTFVVSDRASQDHPTVGASFAPADHAPDHLPVSEFSVRDLMESRPFIEIPAARWAAERRSAEQLASMERIVAMMSRTENSSRWVWLNRQFHTAVAQASNNLVFHNMLTQMRDQMAGQAPDLSIHRKQSCDREHGQILQAIRTRSTRAAETAMAEHLTAVDPELATC